MGQVMKDLAPLSLFIVGEAWGREEALVKAPFVGKVGQELTAELKLAGIDRRRVKWISNVFNLQPAANKIPSLCISRKEAYKVEREDKTGVYPFTAIEAGKYLHPKYFPEVYRLHEEIRQARPNLVLALGNVPLWALTGHVGIMKRRGAVCYCSVEGLERTKLLPTIHPGAIVRDWSLRTIAIADMIKARKECQFPHIQYTEREIWLDPTIDDLHLFERKYIKNFLSVDIETAHGTITCVSISPSPYISIVLPFVDRMRPGYHYWETHSDEYMAHCWLKRLMEDPEIIKLFQNGPYDIQYFWRDFHIKTYGYRKDTMVKYHSQQPEMPKDLGFLGSIHTNEMAWKLMRPRGSKTEKREE